MENTFKYLDSNSSKPSAQKDDAAQKFLDDKLAKNRFTQKQQESLDASGGPTVANASEGFDMNAAAKSSEQAATPAKLNLEYGGVEDFGQWNDSWQAGATQQQLKASGNVGTNAALDEQFTSLAENGGSRVDDEEGWKELSFDTDVKTAEQYEAQVQKWSDAGYDVRAIDMKPGEYAHSNVAVRKGASAAPAAANKEPDPIEHSPEIKQAKQRVKSYEDDILSGKVSDDIYGNNSSPDYSFDATKGSAGIGTPMSGGSSQQASKATASFLDNKKSQVKDKYQFQAQS
jgi:hypothetical protein